MTTGTPWSKLLLFTVPLLVGNVFQQLYSTMDAIILGEFVGDRALAAVGTTMPIFFLVTVLMMGIAMGAGVMVSQYFGAKKREELSYTVGAALTLTTILGVIIMVFAPIFTRPLLVLLETPYEILDDSVLYMNVLLWGILGLAYFNILSGILRGLGDAFSPLLYLAITSILNVFLNLLFIGVLGWGVWGAAIGTVFAQGLTSILCLRRLLQMRNVFDMGLKYLRPNKVYINKVLKLGVPTAASQAVFAIAMMIVQPLVNRFGPMFIAVNIVVMRVDGFVMMPNFSFGNAMTVFAGQNMGANKLDRVSQGLKQCAYLALGTSVILVGTILIFGRYIAGAFTNTPEVVEMSVQFLRILAIGYVIFAVNMVVWGVIRGAGDAMTPMVASFINTGLIRLPSAYLFVFILGRPEALYYSLLLAWVSNTVLGVIAYRVGRWRKMGLVKQKPPMISEMEKHLDGFEVKVITKENFDEVYAVFDSNQEFFKLTEGKETTQEEAVKNIDAIPPDFDIKQKLMISLWLDGKAVGVLDLLIGFPEKENIWIGLLLVHGNEHDKKIGNRVSAAIIESARVLEYKSVQLGVIDTNERGLAFWSGLGFEKIRMSNNIVVMEKTISS